jgi:hypothetical protein
MADESAPTDVLSSWNSRLSSALGIPPADIDVILDLAAVAAHNVVRPAAPITAFLVGYATAMGSAGSDGPTALSDAVSVALTLAAPDAPT